MSDPANVRVVVKGDPDAERVHYRGTVPPPAAVEGLSARQIEKIAEKVAEILSTRFGIPLPLPDQPTAKEDGR